MEATSALLVFFGDDAPRAISFSVGNGSGMWKIRFAGDDDSRAVALPVGAGLCKACFPGVLRRMRTWCRRRVEAPGSGLLLSGSGKLGSSSSRRPLPCLSSVAASGLDEALVLPGCSGTPTVYCALFCATPARWS